MHASSVRETLEIKDKRERESTSISLWSGMLSQKSLHTSGASLHSSQQPGNQSKGYLKKKLSYGLDLN